LGDDHDLAMLRLKVTADPDDLARKRPGNLPLPADDAERLRFSNSLIFLVDNEIDSG
jgi:hypothetical protein